MLGHILYGTSTLTHGGLKFTALAAGERGQTCRVAIIITGSVIVVAANEDRGFGSADLTISIPSGTTESAFIDSVNNNATFRKHLSVEQASGDGTAAVAALALRLLDAPAGGLRQHLVSRLSVAGWGNLDEIVTGAPEGLIWPAEKTLVSETRDRNGSDKLEGKIQIVLVLQAMCGFEEANSIVDFVERRLRIAIKLFTHDALIGKEFIKASLGNMLKPSASGDPSAETDQRRKGWRDLKVSSEYRFEWSEAPYEFEFAAPLEQAQVGLFREPLDDPLGGPGEEVLDYQFTVQ